MNLRNVQPVRQLDRRLAGQQDHEPGERRAEYLRIDGGAHSLLLKSMEEIGFIDAKAGDLRLRPESRCGIGSSEYAAKEDVSNVPRKGSPPDCGAYGR